MLYRPAICLMAVLCLALASSHAQTVDTLTGKLATFPTKLFGKIRSQSADLNRDITRQTEKYLTRMARREQQLQQRLAAIDSSAAGTLFANTQQQYAALAAQLKGDAAQRVVALSGQYLPLADTLQGAMTFLRQYPQLLAKGGNLSPRVDARLQAASGEFQLLQTKLQDAEMIKAYVRSRQEQISDYFAQHSNALAALQSPLAGMQHEEYYYRQSLAQFKMMLSDPSALAQKALSMLGQLPAFQSFMKTHSQLGSLFHVPGNYGEAGNVKGLQTKEQVAGAVQSQLSAAGPAGAAALQNSLQSAQSQLDGYKEKLSKLGMGNGDAPMPNFQPNDEKTKNFSKRLQLGFDFQTVHYSHYYPSLLSLGLRLGYKLGHSNVAGIGFAYTLGTGNGIRDVHLTNQGLQLRSFFSVRLKGSFLATGGFEYNYTNPFASYRQLKQLQRWQKSGLLGVTKVVSMKSKVLKQTTFSLLWDFLSYSQVPRTQPLLFRISYHL